MPARSIYRSLLPVEAALAALLIVVLSWSLAAPGTIPAWEAAIFAWFNRAPRWLFPLGWPIMQLGSVAGAMFVTLVLVVARRRRHAVIYAFATGLAWLAARAIKEIVGRGRPLEAGLGPTILGDVPAGFGFVSGHTAVAFAGAAILAMCFGRRAGWLFFGLATMVALMRMVVGAHLPLDVVGGAAVGTLVAAAVSWFDHRRNRVPRSGSDARA